MGKVCTKCNKTQPLTEFHKHKKSKDGLGWECKECRKILNSISYQKNQEKKKKYQLKRNISHKQYYDEYQKTKNRSEGYGLYTLTHLPTQYFYIGEGWILSRRMCHIESLNAKRNTCIKLQEHYNKYPNIDEWEFKVIYKLDEYNKNEGRELEEFVIQESRKRYSTQVLNTRL